MALENKLKDLDRVLNAFNSEVITNEDFEAKMKRVLEVVKRLVENNARAISDLQAKQEVMLKEISSQHGTSLSELKAQTNELFVGDRLNQMDSNTTARFDELDDLLNERIESIRNGKDGKTPTREELLALMLPLLPKKEDLTDFKETVKTLREDHEKIKKAISKAARTGTRGGADFVSGPNVNAVNFVDVSSQCDGDNKTFFVPTFRKVLALHGTQFPFLYRPTVDFTLGNKQFVLTDEVAPPAKGQSLIMTYIK